MTKKTLLLVTILTLAAPVVNSTHKLTAQQDLLQTIRFRTAFAYEAITLDSTAGGVGFTSATFNPVVTDSPSSLTRAELAVVNCNNAQARYRVDGVAAVTTTNGMLIQDGDWLVIYGFAHISAFKGIRTGATSVVCDVTYYRNRQ